MRKSILLVAVAMATLLACAGAGKKNGEPAWVSLFNGKNLDGWYSYGKATWSVHDGMLVGEGGMGHIYANPALRDLEVKGMFRVSEKGNSGLYFRANPPKEKPEGFPVGYEAQIDNHQNASTGWLWKPGKPTGKANALLAKDNEWFSMRIKAIGPQIQIWVNDELVTEYTDSDFQEGHFALQGHNPGMKIEAKQLYYRDWSKK